MNLSRYIQKNRRMTLRGGALPVSQFKLFDGAKYRLQVALLIFQHKCGESLKHQRHVKHQHRVTGSHVTGLISSTRAFCPNVTILARKLGDIFHVMIPSAASVYTLGVCHI